MYGKCTGQKELNELRDCPGIRMKREEENEFSHGYIPVSFVIIAVLQCEMGDHSASPTVAIGL